MPRDVLFHNIVAHTERSLTNTPVRTVFFQDKMFIGHGGGGVMMQALVSWCCNEYVFLYPPPPCASSACV